MVDVSFSLIVLGEFKRVYIFFFKEKEFIYWNGALSPHPNFFFYIVNFMA